MYCTQCGMTIVSRFCTGCGSPAPASTTSVAPAVARRSSRRVVVTGLGACLTGFVALQLAYGYGVLGRPANNPAAVAMKYSLDMTTGHGSRATGLMCPHYHLPLSRQVFAAGMDNAARETQAMLGRVVGVGLQNVQEDGSKAKVEVTIQYPLGGVPGQVDLVKEDGKWMVSAH